jgi:hypothetical protein
MKRTFRKLILGTAAVVFGMGTAALGDEPGPRGEPRAERTRRVAGEITKIENGTVTLVSRNRSNERAIELKLDENVRVTVESDEKVRVLGESGEVQERRKAVAGKPSDLKVGQRVIATTTFGGVATEISAASALPQGEGERRGDAPRDGERPRGDAPRDGEKPRIDAPRDGERPRGDAPRDGDKPRADAPRDGERPKVDAPRDGEKPRANVVRDGERPRGDAPRDGERPRGDAPRDGEKPRGDAPRDGEPRAAREGDRNIAGAVISGDIAKVSADAISVKTGSSKEASPAGMIRIAPGVQVIIEGNAAQISDLQPGMPVNVTQRNGQAVRIEVPIDLSKPKK